MIHLEVSTKYTKNYRKQTSIIKDAVEEKERIFLQNSHDARLGTHKLHGKDREAWAYWITRKIRIKFMFISPHRVLYLDIGTHDQVY